MIPGSDSVYDIYSLIFLVCYAWVSPCARQGNIYWLIFPMLRFEFSLATMSSQDNARDTGRDLKAAG